jgi:hypothetical protein
MHAICALLPHGELDQPAAFKGWTIKMVLRGLLVWNLTAAVSLCSRRNSRAALAARNASRPGTRRGLATRLPRDSLHLLPRRALRAREIGRARHERTILAHCPPDENVGPRAGGLGLSRTGPPQWRADPQ